MDFRDLFSHYFLQSDTGVFGGNTKTNEVSSTRRSKLVIIFAPK